MEKKKKTKMGKNVHLSISDKKKTAKMTAQGRKYSN